MDRIIGTLKSSERGGLTSFEAVETKYNKLIYTSESSGTVPMKQ
ncbi:hypothetical protein [Vagococcus martis]